MESVLAALKDTPIPTLLVVAGIVFLLLSIAGQLAGRITVPPERQRQATIIGCFLVVVGVALHVVPPRLNPPEPQRGLLPLHYLNQPPKRISHHSPPQHHQALNLPSRHLSQRRRISKPSPSHRSTHTSQHSDSLRVIVVTSHL